MRAAVYTRYSTDNQRASSIGDQLRNCDRRIELEGWTRTAHFSDERISGGTADRAGYQAMLRAAGAGEFEVLVLDELSRAWRDQVESERTIRRFEFARIRIIGVSDGYDSNSKGRKTIRLIHNFKNEQDLEAARERTHRGLSGQAISKFSAGGLPYGYRSIQKTAGDEHLGFDREPHPQQAPIVQEIFARIAAGESMRAVVTDLNARGIPCPGAKWKRTQSPNRFWRVSTLHALLSNEMYIGRYVWNRSRWERDPDTDIRKRFERPKSEWIIHDIPAWRLIDDVTWQRVQKRSNERTELFTGSRGARASYLLSGLIRCGSCGSAYVIAAHRPVRYGCAQHRHAGAVACGNQIMVASDLAEEKILQPIILGLLSDEAIEYGVSVIRGLAAAEAAEPATMDSESLRVIDEQIAKIERLRDDRMLSPSIAAAALERAQNERQAIWRAHSAKRAAGPVNGMFQAAAAYEEAMRKFRRTLTSEDIPAARDALREMMGTIRLVPEDGVLVAEMATAPVALVKAIGAVNLIGSGGLLWNQLRIPLAR